MCYPKSLYFYKLGLHIYLLEQTVPQDHLQIVLLGTVNHSINLSSVKETAMENKRTLFHIHNLILEQAKMAISHIQKYDCNLVTDSLIKFHKNDLKVSTITMICSSTQLDSQD